MTRPNVLLLMSDQHRADVMGCAGDPVVRTPNIDRMAAQGTMFTNVHCQGPLCMPARASFLTERYVRDHGVYENSWDTPATAPTFLHQLQAVGYHTACIGKMHLWRHSDRSVTHTRQRIPYLGALGFDEAIESCGKLASARIHSDYTDHLEARGLYDTYRTWIADRTYRGESNRATLPNWATGSIPLPMADYSDVWHGDRAVRWIEEYDRDEPWFLWVGFPGPHDPWDAPAEAVDRYRDVAMPMPGSTIRPEIPDENPFRDFLRYWLWVHSDSAGLEDAQIQELRRYYYANVTIIDDAVGRIRHALERTGQDRNTWVIYTSDHGEMLGEHRMIMKMVFYEAATKVPVVIRPPGGMDATTVVDLIEHLDVAATIRAIADAPTSEVFEGRSLLGHLEPARNEPPRSRAWSENFGFAMVRTDRYKLVIHEDTLTAGQLFDLADDPTEDHNLVAEPGAQGMLDELMEIHVRPFLRDGRVKPGPGAFERARQTPEAG